MKVGSLVVCVNSNGIDKEAMPLYNDKIYTVRELCYRCGNLCVLLCEITNINYINGEGAYRIERFRELDTPTEIKLENILELEIV